ncbi:MAG: Holliday junction branch migration protein RuvA [Actinomycetales bacterium]|nr:Holliday junction branch migration protein RuvA [Actinomycetales bacterium]
MIASLRGSVASLGLDHVVLEAGGVGFACLATPTTLAHLRVGEVARLATTLVVRDDSLTLYGFRDDDEREVFLAVQTVTGIGPRLAMSILAVLTPDELRRAIRGEDLGVLQRVPGIGRKVAQRLVLELAGKLGEPHGEVPEVPAAGPDEDIVAALVSLGWPQRDAAAAVAAVSGEGRSRAEVLRAALQHLAAGRG